MNTYTIKNLAKSDRILKLCKSNAYISTLSWIGQDYEVISELYIKSPN